MPKTEVHKILCPYCEEIVKVTFSEDSKGEIEIHFAQFPQGVPKAKTPSDICPFCMETECKCTTEPKVDSKCDIKMPK